MHGLPCHAMEYVFLQPVSEDRPRPSPDVPTFEDLLDGAPHGEDQLVLPHRPLHARRVRHRRRRQVL